MRIIEVTNSITKKEFLNVSHEVYKNDNVWVCPLYVQIETVFDPKKNRIILRVESDRFPVFYISTYYDV